MSEASFYRFRAAGVQGFLAVACGAFGAHALGRLLPGLSQEELARRQSWAATGAHYQLVHAAALLALGALEGRTGSPRALAWAGPCLFWGPLLFAASLYALACGAPFWTGAITPIGGVLMLAGWALVFRAGTAPRP